MAQEVKESGQMGGQGQQGVTVSASLQLQKSWNIHVCRWWLMGASTLPL